MVARARSIDAASVHDGLTHAAKAGVMRPESRSRARAAAWSIVMSFPSELSGLLPHARIAMEGPCALALRPAQFAGRPAETADASGQPFPPATAALITCSLSFATP